MLGCLECRFGAVKYRNFHLEEEVVVTIKSLLDNAEEGSNIACSSVSAAVNDYTTCLEVGALDQ